MESPTCENRVQQRIPLPANGAITTWISRLILVKFTI